MQRSRKSRPLYCDGKRAYDKRGAVTAANKRYKEDHVLLRIYPCRGHWHLTSQTRGKPYVKRKRNIRRGDSDGDDRIVKCKHGKKGKNKQK